MAAQRRAMHDPRDLHPQFRELLLLGTDEVGTGSIAGPVVAAACVVSPFDPFIQAFINDSKKVPRKHRTEIADEIKACATVYRIETISQQQVELHGPRKAANRAMAQAVNACRILLDQRVPRHRRVLVVVDGGFVLDINAGVEQICVTKADQKFLSVAAASILAKDHRDRLMAEQGKTFPQYLFEKNAGYGTEEHTAAIHEYGMCPLHRTSMALSALRKWEERHHRPSRTSLRRGGLPGNRLG